MHRQGPFTTKLVAQLTNGLNERQGFNITNRAANFAQDKIEILRLRLGEFHDRIGDVRNDLNGRAEIISATFFLNNSLINASRRNIVRLPRRNAGKAFIMPKV